MRVIQQLLLVILATLSLSANATPSQEKPKSIADFKSVEIFKSKSCNCCNKYAKILRKEGLAPLVRNTDAVRSLYIDLEIEQAFRSCHITVADGYFFSGHVPPQDIKTVLKDKPKIRGLLVPRMPAGSPGMEVPGHPGETYKIYSLDFRGSIEEYRTQSPKLDKASEVLNTATE